jgi:hypothetical protein
MQAGLAESLDGGHALVEDVPDVLDGGGYDARAAGGAD